MDKIWICFKGEFYAHEFVGFKTLSEVIRAYDFDRKQIKEWWKTNN